jgi:hypothetical protein
VRIRTFLTVRQPRLHGKPDHVARQRNGRNGRNPSPNDHSVARGACSVGDPPSLTHSLTHRSRGVAWVPRVAAGNPRVNPGARVRACGDERGASLPPPPAQQQQQQRCRCLGWESVIAPMQRRCLPSELLIRHAARGVGPRA